MKNIKNISIIIIVSSLWILIWIWTAYAINNYNKIWINWDASVDPDPSVRSNDEFTLSWRLDIEDSNSDKFIDDDYRWKISWMINSRLFWDFNPIWWSIDLIKSNTKNDCWEWKDTFFLSWSFRSVFWWDMTIEPTSYFCENQYTKLDLNSQLLWNKEIWIESQTGSLNNLWKQKIQINWIVKAKWDWEILADWNNEILKLDIEISAKSLSKKMLNKNVFYIVKTLYDSNTNLAKSITEKNELKSSDFTNNNDENYYIYKYSLNNSDLNYSKWDLGKYVNKWEILELWENQYNHIEVDWKQNIIVEWWNIYIKSNIYNKDKESILILVSKEDIDWNWWNIYIDTDVTNIDAVLISDRSILSMTINTIQEIEIHKDNLRKQLLIYWSIFSSNNIWWDIVPYGADYYKNFTDNKIEKSIYDLSNLRTFNLNYGKADFAECSDENILVPIDWLWWYKLNAWAGRKKCYNSDSQDTADIELRTSDKINPVIVEYNTKIQIIKPYLLNNN